MATPLEKAKRSRASYAGWLTRCGKECQKFITNLADDQVQLTKVDYDECISEFDLRMTGWDDAQAEVELLVEEVDLNGEIDAGSTFRISCRQQRTNVVKAWEKKNAPIPDPDSSSNSQQNVKLPKLTMSKYDGEDILGYMPFWGHT